MSSPTAPADLAVVAVPPEAIVGVMEEIGAAGIRHAVVITTGLGRGPGRFPVDHREDDPRRLARQPDLDDQLVGHP